VDGQKSSRTNCFAGIQLLTVIQSWFLSCDFRRITCVPCIMGSWLWKWNRWKILVWNHF